MYLGRVSKLFQRNQWYNNRIFDCSSYL